MKPKHVELRDENPDMIAKSHNSRICFSVVSGLLFLFFVSLAIMFPYTGDDWAWGSPIGIDRLNTFFENYNGRYFGNFLILAISRSKALKVVLMALCYYGSCWLCYKYTPSKRNASLLLATVLFFAMPRTVFMQSVVWASGFANYVPPALISVAYVLLVRNTTGEERPRYRKLLWIPTFLMGFCGALFIENLTVFNICLGTAVIGYVIIRFKRCYAVHIGFLAGAVSGAVWMFSNSAYSSIYKGADDYRQVATGLGGIIKRCLGNGYVICDYVIVANYWICLATSALLLLLAVQFVKGTDHRKHKAYAKSAIIINGFCLAAILCKNLLLTDPGHLAIKMFMMLVAVLYAVSIVVIVLLCVEKSRRFHMLFPFCCILASVAPLLLVSPIGPRCFYVSHLLTIVFVTDLFSYVVNESGIKKAHNKKILWVLGTVALLQAILYVSIFLPINQYDSKRNEFAKLQSDRGESKIVISSLPNDHFLWTSDPTKEPWNTRYKLFYGIREDAELVGVSPAEFDQYYYAYINQAE